MTTQPSIGIGLIGVGRHGLRYARHIVHDLPGASLVAVCRQHPEQGLELPGCDSVTVYGRAEALVGDPAVDVVVIVTPPLVSRDLCLLAIQAGKPVLVEKPLATNAGEARAMVEAAARSQVPLMTAQTLRFDATIQALKANRPRIGRSQRLVLTSHIETKGRGLNHFDGYGKRGALLEFGVHLLDLVRFLTGEEVREARCTMDPVPPAAPDEVASVQLVTRQGLDCLIEVASTNQGRVGTAVWWGSGGRLTADWVTQQLQWTGSDDRTETWTLPACPTVRVTLQAFLDAVRLMQPMPITGGDGFRAVEIADACYRSAASQGAPVALPLLTDAS